MRTTCTHALTSHKHTHKHTCNVQLCFFTGSSCAIANPPHTWYLLAPALVQDLPHTYSTHPWISSPDGQASLKRVLSAYAAHNDKVRTAQLRARASLSLLAL